MLAPLDRLRALLLTALLPLLVSCTPGAAGRVRVLPPTEVQGVWHRLESGESLAQIAKRHGIALIDLEEINGLDHRQALAAGRLLFVPKRLDAPVVGAHPERRKARPRRTPPRAAPALSTDRKVAWPVEGGRLSSRFGRRGKRVHEGIDIAAAEGTPVRAAEAGRVLYAGAGIRGYGNLVILRHQGDLVSVYAHNRRNLVRRGDRVTRGQRIAEVGHTGRTSGNHLHFELRRGEVPIDPLPYLVRPRARP